MSLACELLGDYTETMATDPQIGAARQLDVGEVEVSLSEIARRVSACRACPRLVDWRETVARERRAAFRDEEYWGRGVPGFGDADATLVVVGLAPATHGANRTGRMFTGDRSGDWLFASMYRTGWASQPESTYRDDGLTLKGAWVTSPVKCAPPANRPTREERDRCAPFLTSELAALRSVRVMVVLGGFGYEAIRRTLGLVGMPKFGHGVEASIPADRWPGAEPGDERPRTLLCSYHVSQQNTFTGRLTEAMLDSVFVRARQLVAPA